MVFQYIQSCTTIIIILEHFHSLQKETSRLLAVIHKYCPPGSPVYYQDSIVENNRNLLSQFWKAEVNNQLSAGLCALPRLEWRTLPYLSGFWKLQAFLGLWLHHSSLCLHLRVAFSLPCLLFLSYKDTYHWIQGPSGESWMPASQDSQLHLQRLFSNNIIFINSWDQDTAVSFQGPSFNAGHLGNHYFIFCLSRFEYYRHFTSRFLEMYLFT